jgi:hypothetical protein
MWALYNEIMTRFAYVPEFLAEYREHKILLLIKVIKLGKILKILKSYNDYNWLSQMEISVKCLRLLKEFVYWMLDETLTNWFIIRTKNGFTIKFIIFWGI